MTDDLDTSDNWFCAQCDGTFEAGEACRCKAKAGIATRFANDAYMLWLKTPDGGSCSHVKPLSDGIYAAIKPLLFHWTMIIGMLGDKETIMDSYCFADQDRALLALIQWNGTGDPIGWTRHPKTGRRRPGGLASQEYIHF